MKNLSKRLKTVLQKLKMGFVFEEEDHLKLIVKIPIEVCESIYYGAKIYLWYGVFKVIDEENVITATFSVDDNPEAMFYLNRALALDDVKKLEKLYSQKLWYIYFFDQRNKFLMALTIYGLENNTKLIDFDQLTVPKDYQTDTLNHILNFIENKAYHEPVFLKSIPLNIKNIDAEISFKNNLQIKYELLGYKPKDAANRAIQALYGLISLILLKNSDQLNEIAKNAITDLEYVNSLNKDDKCIEIYNKKRDDFLFLLNNANITFFSCSHDRIWKLFIERFHFNVGQLRANLSDLFECFNIDILTKNPKRNPKYFERLPLSSEIILFSGGKIEIFIPPRLLILDMILMLVHAREEDKKLKKTPKSNDNKFIILRDGRLDSYCRQILILATTICDSILNGYGEIIEGILKFHGAGEDIFNEFQKYHKQGVTARLEKLPEKWCSIFKTERKINLEAINDMINLVQIRNRLIHPDNRDNCWHAFNLNPLRWNFSERIKEYLTVSSYGVHSSFIGYEFYLAKFCVDTVIEVIDSFHNIIYPDTDNAEWIEIPRNKKSGIEIDQIIEKEKILQI